MTVPDVSTGYSKVTVISKIILLVLVLRLVAGVQGSTRVCHHQGVPHLCAHDPEKTVGSSPGCKVSTQVGNRDS